MSTMQTPRLPLYIPLLVLLSAAAIAGACGPVAEDGPPEDDDPVTVTDDRGGEAVFSRPPSRIVSIGPVNTEILYAIGAGDLLVGVDMYSDWPPAAGELENVGDLREPNAEVISALQPDAIIMSHTTLETIEKLEGMGLTVVAFRTDELEDLHRIAGQLGAITGRTEGAERLTTKIDETFACIRNAIGEVKDHPRVFFEIDPDPLWTAGGGSFPDRLIELAEGANIFSDLDPWAEVSSEAVIERNPDVIIGTLPQTRQMIESGERPGWQQIAAVRDDRIELLEADLLHRAGPRLVFGFADMARAIWPQRLGQLPCVNEYEDSLMQWIDQ